MRISSIYVLSMPVLFVVVPGCGTGDGSGKLDTSPVVTAEVTQAVTRCSISCGPSNAARECSDGQECSCECRGFSNFPANYGTAECSCSYIPPPYTPRGSISANPGSVVIPPGKFAGTTRVCWESSVEWSQVWVSVDGAPDSLFAMERWKGCADADWIQAGRSVEFRLYEGKGHSNILARVTVIGPPLITASPNPVIIPAGQVNGSTTISWVAPGYDLTSVYVSVDGEAETLMASSGRTGRATPTWISVGHDIRFILYSTANLTTALASVTVTGHQ